MSEPLIVAAAETPYTRHPAPEVTTEQLLADSFRRALASAELRCEDVDGLGVSSFTLSPDHAIDLAWRLGLRLRWLMEDTNGGASGINLLQHAARAIEAGDASTIVLLAGDRFDRDRFQALVDHYNRATEERLAPIPFGGPNALFALLTQRHMERYGLERADYGRVAVAQRRWAARNPQAVYREPMTIEEYLQAPIVAYPLSRYDCPPVVSGADALVLRAAPGRRGVRIRAIVGMHNTDGQAGDGLTTGLRDVSPELWTKAGYGPEDVDVVSVYDDYPVMVLAQLADLGFVPDDDPKRFLETRLERLPLNTSGGQLSAGQAGAAGGMHGLVEVVTQLLGNAGARQVPEARRAVVSGYGMVVYRYGACANAVALETA